MPEAYLHALSLSDAGDEEPAATRERLKDRFPRGATRRMTQLGMLVGVALDEVGLSADDTLVYASSFAETRALEGYLESFPAASPTLFQTSIHPSAVQQALIGRQHPVQEFFPLTGAANLTIQAMQTALLAPASRVLLCGGEERGTWLLKQGVASDRSFGFALALSPSANGARAKISLAPAEETAPATAFSLYDLFGALRDRKGIDFVGPGRQRLKLDWL